MEKGLIWLPLLGLFIWLAGAGWNESQKIQGYRIWAKPFRQAKYDIYAALGYDGQSLLWGKPTRQGLINLDQVDLKEVRSILLMIDGEVREGQLPKQGKAIGLLLTLTNNQTKQIPFTDINIAAHWQQYLQAELQNLQMINVTKPPQTNHNGTIIQDVN